MDIQPFGKHVILEPLEAPEKIGEIFLSDEHRDGIEKRALGMVVAIGKKANEAMIEMGEEPLEIGDIVVYWKPGAGTIQGKDLKQKVYCAVDSLIGAVTRDDPASTKEFKHELDKAEKRERDWLNKAQGRGIVTAAGQVPRIVE